ncbi:MAG: helix-turn-helix transcriptional regulator [Sphingopyxis sp.]|nr:helix-turn-helix transcriptional regulator [Sphingopyxis sp.]
MAQHNSLDLGPTANRLEPMAALGGSYVRPATAAFDDASRAIHALGPRAKRLMPPAATVQFGEWLDWPHWFKDGTSLDPGAGLPDRISVADDLRIVANIIDHGHGFSTLSRLFNEPKIAGSPVVGPALYNAPSLLDALHLFKRSLEIGSPFVTVCLATRHDRFLIGIETDIDDGPVLTFVATAMLLMAQRFVGMFNRDAPQQTQLLFRCARDEALANFLSGMPGTCQFGAEGYALRGIAQWLGEKNSHTDQAFWSFALERMSVMEREGRQSELVERIRSAIGVKMQAERRVPRLKQIAAKEGISERTLVRNLAAQGTSFHQLVEEERRLKATELIGNDKMSLSEVALALGFTDMSSFGRSYRQWFGVTPGQARNRRLR